MGGYRIISSDDHIMEPLDLWINRIEPKYRDRAPQVVRMEDGGDWWFCDGIRGLPASSAAQVGLRFEDPGKLTYADIYENVPLGGYIPEEHAKDMDADGVDISVVYPTVGLSLYAIPDSELVTEMCRTYNDWLAEYCKPIPSRLKGVAMINVDDVGIGIREMERCAKMGLTGAMVTVYPNEDRSYDFPEYEPLWATAQELGMPLSLHAGTYRTTTTHAPVKNLMGKPSFYASLDHWMRISLANMIFSGVFERFPNLQVGSIETELCWVPHFLDRMDYTFSQRPHEQAPYRFKEDMLPSDYFHRNVFMSFQEDVLGIQLRHIIGVNTLQWGSDYPHVEGTFPRSRQILEDILADCTEEEKAKIAGANAARVYRLD